ncbi:hypothetical protein cypCar_00021463 [Cyprinus carpio]|uniref:Ig-like domain-containing protein n=2 Tax=Cyprinus carpio TaxID=7962 RepID=A0A9J8AMZ8_CYPCA|nr:uncharacterized protein LOC109046399 [Cyprinus carpio]KTG34201.1 hypothetical protein cypCar_00021463 [Cyprinus carpio]
MLLQYLFLMLLDGAFGAETDETVSVMEGDSVTLHTNLTEVLNDDTILWLFGRKDSIISQITRKQDLTSFFVTDDARFRGRLQVDQKTGTLTIRKTRIKHSGQYKLTVSRKQTTTKIFNVTVIDVVGETDGVKSVSVMEGDPVTLQCDVSEVQRDDLIVWRFGDKGLLLAKIDVESNETLLNDADERFRDRLKLSESRSLTIKKTRTTDSGLYEVQIRGSESSQRFLLSVSAVPDSGLSPGFIAGIVLAVLLVAAVVAAVVIYYRRKISELQKQVEPIKEVSVADGESVTLKTETVLKNDDMVQWWYHDDNDLIAVISGETKGTFDGFDERFRSKLMLDYKTGNLTINNTMSIHSGLYILQISSENRKINRRFIVTVKMMKVSVVKGGSVTLETRTKIQRADEILWTFGAENCLVVRADPRITIGERFTGRLKLDEKTGSLSIRNIKTADSGHFKLQIINSEKTTFRRFNVSVTESTGKQVNESAAVEMPLLNRENVDGVNE